MLDNNKLVGKLATNRVVGRVLTKLLGLDYVWDGTRLGIKKETETEYTYADLKGDTGPTGPAGHTPEKGVDYFTQQDIASIAEISTGSTQPTTNEKVWLQKGKNLLNKGNLIPGVYTVNGGTYSSSDNNICTKDMIEIDSSKNYVLSTGSNDDSIYMYVMYYDTNKIYLGYTASTLKTPIILNSYSNYSNTKYINLRFDMINVPQPMLEQGNAKTTYEEYVAKIHTLDDNIFREFLLLIDEIYRTSEVRIGTWIDGKPLYRKVVKSNTFASSYTLGISDIAEFIDVQAIIYRKDYSNLWAKVPSRLSNSQYFVDFGNIDKNNNGTIDILWGSSHSSNTVQDITFIVEYTKTTD